MTIDEMQATLRQIIKQNEPIAKVDMQVIKEMLNATYHIKDELEEAHETKAEAREARSSSDQIDAYKDLLEEHSRIDNELDNWFLTHSSSKDILTLMTKAEYDKYKDLFPTIKGNYWLRDTTPDLYRVWLDNGTAYCSSTFYLRPVLHVTPVTAKIFNETLMNWRNKNWYKLDENLWISLEAWDKMNFDPDTSDYENSAIRKYLYGWYVNNN